MTTGFSHEWDRLYRDGRQRTVWPWSDIVSLVYRHALPANGFRRVIELGCGAGANIPFFLKLGCDYCAIEGSEAAVADLHRAFPELQPRIRLGDFTKVLPFEGPFDLAVDRSSLTHNNVAAVRNALDLVFDALRPGGKFVGVDWFSAAHSDATCGRAVDAFSRADIPGGQFHGVGTVHFADRAHLVALLDGAGFVIERLEHKEIERIVPVEPGRFAAWNFVAVKP